MPPLLVPLLVAMVSAFADPTTRVSPTISPVGTYVIQLVNGHTLPFSDRLRTNPGYEHRARLDRAFLRLDRKGTFVFTVRSAHVHAARAAIEELGPASDDYVTGRWTIHGTQLVLVVDRSSRGRQSARIVGQLVRGRLVLPVDIGNGFTRRHYVLVARYDASYF